MALLYGLASRRSGLIGLDIGTTSVKAARIRRRGDRATITGIARAPIDATGPATQTADDRTVMAIWRCLRTLRARGGVACSVAGPEVAIRTFEFPALPRHQLASAVELEAAQVCPFEVSEAAVSYHVLTGPPAKGAKPPTDAERISGFFAAAENKIIQRRRALCERGDASCVLMDVDGLALLNCLEACKRRKTGEAAMVLNVGHTYTNLAIVSEDGLPFVRDISFASDQIVNRIAQIVGSPPWALVTALEGGAEPEVPWSKVQPAVRQACTGLADRVAETLRYYGARRSGPAVDRVFLCGGFTQSGPVAKALISLLPAKTELWDPLAVLPCTRAVRKSPVAEYGPALAVAVGLALRTLRDVHD
jgi:type IV pilus assembly protein PilM